MLFIIILLTGTFTFFFFPQGFKNIEMNAFSLPHFKTPNEKLILELHNQIRRAVIPTARNMLKMVSYEFQLFP